jgi:hypothetical protein
VWAVTQGEISEQWIKRLRSQKKGRADVKALSNHFGGKGNVTRRIAEAERLCDTLHYKSEQSLPSATFLSQRMFNLFEQNGESFQEPAKMLFLFDKTQHAGLFGTISALKISQNLNPEACTFMSAVNHLAAEASQLPGFQLVMGRKLLALETSGRSQGAREHITMTRYSLVSTQELAPAISRRV